MSAAKTNPPSGKTQIAFKASEPLPPKLFSQILLPSTSILIKHTSLAPLFVLVKFPDAEDVVYPAIRKLPSGRESKETGVSEPVPPKALSQTLFPSASSLTNQKSVSPKLAWLLSPLISDLDLPRTIKPPPLTSTPLVWEVTRSLSDPPNVLSHSKFPSASVLTTQIS